MAFTVDIGVPGPDGVHQRAPEWLVVFVPFLRRDTKNSLSPNSVEDAVAIEAPIIVTSDCVALTVSESKGTPCGSLQAMFRGGNLNYGARVAPGDYVFVWAASKPDRIRKTEKKVRAGEQCNGWDSGLKFFGRVTSMRERLSVDPMSGIKQLIYTMTGNSFAELNTKVYFNAILYSEDRPPNFITELSKNWTDHIGPSGMSNSQDLVLLFLNIFMGAGPVGRAKAVAGLLKTPNAAFVIPGPVATMLGRRGSKEKTTYKYTDILDVIAGVQKYSFPGDGASGDPWVRLQPDMPSDRAGVRQKALAKKVSGCNVSMPDVFSANAVWSILNSYANTTVNELFTATRPDGKGAIVPTLVHRQIPFTTPEYINRISGKVKPLPGKPAPQTATAKRFTSFFEIPRWRPDPSSVYEYDLGRTDAARVNFVQVWGTSNDLERANASQADQVARGNFYQDDNDIRRSGLRSHVDTSYFDWFPGNSKEGSNSPAWAHWNADWLVNGHLKTNGSINMMGVNEPIAIGDNLEWMGIVYHIEQVTHTCTISADGIRSFRTSLSLSNGLDTRSELVDITVYPWMDKPNRENLATEDDDNEKVLPGYTDVQASPDRSQGELRAKRPNVDVNRVPPTSKKPTPKKPKKPKLPKVTFT